MICPLLRGSLLYQRSFFLSCVVRNHRRPFIIIPSLQQNAAGIAQRHPLQCARVCARAALETERNADNGVGFFRRCFRLLRSNHECHSTPTVPDTTARGRQTFAGLNDVRTSRAIIRCVRRACDADNKVMARSLQSSVLPAPLAPAVTSRTAGRRCFCSVQ